MNFHRVVVRNINPAGKNLKTNLIYIFLSGASEKLDASRKYLLNFRWAQVRILTPAGEINLTYIVSLGTSCKLDASRIL